MNHVFNIYNMANLENHIIAKFMDKINKEFLEFGYLKSQITLMPFSDKSPNNNFDSESAIIISKDNICNNFSRYGSAKDFWPYIRENIDLILITGAKPHMYWPSVQTPILQLEKLNYTTAVGILLNYNCN